MPIVNTTGAGDCFTAAFVARLSQLSTNGTTTTENYKKCMNFANACAYLCITKEGAMPAMPTKDEANSFIQKYLKEEDF